MIELLLCLFIKHFICDFPLQALPWMYRNKGTYGHIGGIAHASVHGIGTLLVLVLLPLPCLGLQFIVALVLFDIVLHYHIDYAKMQLGARFNLKPDNSEWFWILLGIDQLLHALTYFAIVYLILINT